MPSVVDASDGELARAVAARAPGTCEAAESELYRRFAPRVRLYGLRHLRDEESARDLVQQVMMLTIEKLRRGDVRDPDQIASFVLGTSRTMAMAARRTDARRERLREAFVAPDAFAAPDPGATLDLDRLEQCMAQLADRERSVVLLTFYAESGSAAVAADIGVSEGNVRVIRHRALAKLRACVLAGRQAS
ncbi:MAG TPA: sigma-70 family RNA polymerase sigma factor [Vicinamibacterales bacterium]|jgi:RNA polymerase sigma-70 factor (ECF subfamily)|nr:sigma-70 family RNA polymerase sigma factor [Vicinamibacterales bacterium]